ncbi:hypothetical protein FEM48_Zijuj04G0168400 [Ziziphus jujuba var. spinosa]|uniref:F-box domain-containing protein n=1 Tax=Ziziphus jujuba var. spinosa TaxID=714518 RepID=A0A978VL14_ZIZJJ|nr:hypothetical protein FEM48_Zijuj04G0168400 [Ziziphus jujuba var. spinosa]
MATKVAKKHCRRKEGIDRISELPDPLIYHILSFLPTFYAVRMSIVSKRWRHMWIYTSVLHFEDFKSLTLLKLKGFRLEDSFPVNLESLKVLCLERVNIYGRTSLQNLISGCPIIEDLCLRDIYFQLSKDIVAGATLRNLTLWNLRLTDEMVDDLGWRHPLLEKLTMRSCSNLNHISIQRDSLKSLFLAHDCPIEIKIMTPNLVSFVFEGLVMSNISVFDAPNLVEATLKLLDTRLDNRTWFPLILFLSYFKFLKKMTLCFCFQENVIIPKDVRNICCRSLPTLKHLKVKMDNDTLWTNSEIRDSFVWCAPSLETFEMEYLSYTYFNL